MIKRADPVYEVVSDPPAYYVRRKGTDIYATGVQPEPFDFSSQRAAEHYRDFLNRGRVE